MRIAYLLPALLAGFISACTPSAGRQNGQDEATMNGPAPAPEVSQAQPVSPQGGQAARPDAASHLTQCNRDLESLRTVSLTAYRRYQSEYDGLMKSSAGFMAVRDDVSPEVAELARPKFQFALVNLCYRIKDALAQTLINQAGGR